MRQLQFLILQALSPNQCNSSISTFPPQIRIAFPPQHFHLKNQCIAEALDNWKVGGSNQVSADRLLWSSVFLHSRGFSMCVLHANASPTSLSKKRGGWRWFEGPLPGCYHSWQPSALPSKLPFLDVRGTHLQEHINSCLFCQGCANV